LKNLFKLFNDIDIDVNEFEEVEVTEFEKAQYKKNLKTMVSKSKSRQWMKSAAAVCLSLGIGTASIVGLSYTSFAEEIPIVNSIFKLFSSKESQKILSGYDEFADSQNIIVESNGTKITINETLFDSKKFLIGYYIETDKDLGEIALVDANFHVNESTFGLFNVEHQVEKVGENQYVGLTTAILPLSTSLPEANVEFEINSLSSVDNKDMISGNWDFELYGKATETTVQIVEAPISHKDDLSVEIDTITYTPISFFVNYKESMHNQLLADKYNIIYSELIIKDDLGNTYDSRFNGGKGNVLGEMEYLITFEKLHPDAKTLIISPVFLMKDLDNIFEIKESIELDDIVIEIQK